MLKNNKLIENVGDSKNRYRLKDKVAEALGLTLNKSKRYRIGDITKDRLSEIRSNPKIMVYDIETSRVTLKAWWTGKTYIRHQQIVTEPKIISISWKWLDSEEIYDLTWDKKHCDKKMVKTFLKEYNNADMVIGQNNDNFDNRWLNARALKHRLFVNVYVKSFDLMKQSKRVFRLLSYSMDYTTKYLGTTFKQSHEGIKMWDMIEDGTKSQQKEYLAKMVKYNKGDIVSTEEMFIEMLPYLGNVTHFGVMMGKSKSSCPRCGSERVRPFKEIFTAAGTEQHIMGCKECGTQYKISKTEYEKRLENGY